MKSMAGLSSVDTGLLTGLGDMGSNLAKGVALLTMQNILKIDGDGKTSLKSVFSPDKQKKAEAALQSYKSRAASIASSKGWSAGEISKKNKESVDLYIKEIEPLIDSTDEKKAFNDILLSSSSSLTEKLMPVDPLLLTPTPTGASTTALADALKTAVIEGMKASAPMGGTPAPTVKAEPEEEEEEEEDEDEPDAKINIKVVPNITQDEVNETLQAMLKDGKGSSDVRTLNIATLGDIIVYAKLNETKEFKEFFQKRDTSKVVNKNKPKMVAAMMADGELNKILINIAIGNIMKNGTTTQCWKQIRDNGIDFIAAYQSQATTPQQLQAAASSTPPSPVLGAQTTPQTSAPASPNLGPLPGPNIPPLSPTPATPGGNGRKRKKNTQNKAQVHLKEIAQILKKYT